MLAYHSSQLVWEVHGTHHAMLELLQSLRTELLHRLIVVGGRTNRAKEGEHTQLHHAQDEIWRAHLMFGKFSSLQFKVSLRWALSHCCHIQTIIISIQHQHLSIIIIISNRSIC